MNKTIIIIGIIVAALGISGLVYANAKGATAQKMDAHTSQNTANSH